MKVDECAGIGAAGVKTKLPVIDVLTWAHNTSLENVTFFTGVQRAKPNEGTTATGLWVLKRRMNIGLKPELLGSFIWHNGKILRPLAVYGFRKSFGGQAPFEQLSDCGGPARHPLCESPRIDDPQFRWRQHNLEPLGPVELTHLTFPVSRVLLQPMKPKISS
ncbi:hypothetical protein [Bradyrhizobium neotropicale]|uniref:hypothetical protein n=1 Tax=Bradyrhizobium neotropicale TaxID=1497615 RepID=UPI001AD67D68|nr:hypothetical protein [Bradyrhizobium neotropicale]MBO4220954.1 hypothetical protein [Bradyrhizobium neotropicale]